jgi:methyl-accepting chemotaxis protein
MGALIGAGALLSPILVTLGFGLAGFGAAAAGAILPIENAAKKTGGLQANMKLLDPEQQAVAKSILALGDQYAAFQLKLKPEVLGVFGKGLSLAGHLMQDVEPVAAATGKALGGLIGQIDAEFRSNNWQNFFHFMAQTAGPDIKLLGDAFVSLTGDLPTLLEGLQPVAEALLTVVNYTGQAIRLSELASTNFSSLGKSTQQSGDGFNATTTGLKAVVPGLQAADNFARELGQGIDILYGNSGKAAKGTQDLAAKARDEAAASKAQTAEINKLNAAVTTHIAKILTLEGDEVSWKQAQQAATTAINANKHALDGNSTSALAARAAIIQSTSAVIKFADDSNTSTGALRRGSSALQDQVTWLERHAGKSKIAADEIRALREEEAKIKREIDQRINVQGTGRFSVAGAGLPGGIGHRTGATGGRVPGFGGGDVHPYLLEGGEAIVPKHLTPAVAPFLKAQGVPGFATGGIIPDYRGGIPGLGPWAVGNTQTTLRLLDQSVASAVAAAVRAAATAFAGPTGGSTGPGAAAAQSWMRAHMGDYGWSAAQFPALQALWNGESGWRWNAQNPTSPAYGIPQADPGSKMAAAGADWRTNPVTQMRWGAEYIRETPGYGTPSATYAKWLARNPHWYGSGLDATFSSPTLIGVGERGPERVQVTPGTGSGGNTYNITVHVPPSANQAEIGRHLVTAIGAFEKRSGKGWRK